MFFDLSIPYAELSSSNGGESAAKTLSRRRYGARAMELGYVGVAYDRHFRGVMSESDRCRIPRFSIESLAGVSPAVVSSSAFRRGLVGAPKDEPFRQYTRITVAVDKYSVGTAFNAKSVLRSYDLVAARPGDQDGFNQACQVSEVDIISLDFPLKFRMKLPMVEAAIKRGVHFEISYSSLISDEQRKKMLSDARLLVGWTRGKNLILSSSADSLNDIRGPYDVANLASFLLGLSKERAKAAISTNCRSLIGNALRKKDYKEAIRIEKMPGKQLDWFKEWNDWDPISSGEHDLSPLDDTPKPKPVTSKLPKSFSAIDFLSSDNSFSLKDQISGPGDVLPTNKETESEFALKILSSDATETTQEDEPEKIIINDAISADQMPSEWQIPHSDQLPPSSVSSLATGFEKISDDLNDDENLPSFTKNTVLLRPCDIQLKHCTFEHEGNLVPLIDSSSDHVEQPMKDHQKSDCADIVTDAVEIPKAGTGLADCSSGVLHDHSSMPMEEDSPKLRITTAVEGEQKDVKMDFVRPPSKEREKSGLLPDVIALPNDEMEEQEEGEEQVSAGSDKIAPIVLKIGKGRRKAKPLHPLPFKSLLKPRLFKKRARQSRRS